MFHSGAGAFDIPLPGVECRQSVNGSFQFIVTMNEAVMNVSQPKVLAGSVKAVTVSKTGVSQFAIDVAGAANAQHLSMVVSVETATGTSEVPVDAYILAGDVNGDGSVNAADALLANKYSVTLVADATFRADIDASGAIDKNDVDMVRANSGMMVQ